MFVFLHKIMIMFKSVSWASPYTLKMELVLNEDVTDFMFKFNISPVISYVSVSYILPQFQPRNREINIAVTDLFWYPSVVSEHTEKKKP